MNAVLRLVLMCAVLLHGIDASKRSQPSQRHYFCRDNPPLVSFVFIDCAYCQRCCLFDIEGLTAELPSRAQLKHRWNRVWIPALGMKRQLKKLSRDFFQFLIDPPPDHDRLMIALRQLEWRSMQLSIKYERALVQNPEDASAGRYPFIYRMSVYLVMPYVGVWCSASGEHQELEMSVYTAVYSGIFYFSPLGLYRYLTSLCRGQNYGRHAVQKTPLVHTGLGSSHQSAPWELFPNELITKILKLVFDEPQHKASFSSIAFVSRASFSRLFSLRLVAGVVEFEDLLRYVCAFGSPSVTRRLLPCGQGVFAGMSADLRYALLSKISVIARPAGRPRGSIFVLRFPLTSSRDWAAFESLVRCCCDKRQVLIDALESASHHTRHARDRLLPAVALFLRQLFAYIERLDDSDPLNRQVRLAMLDFFPHYPSAVAPAEP